MNKVLDDAVNEVMSDFANTGRVFINECHFQYEFTLALFSKIGSGFTFTLEYSIPGNRIDLLVESKGTGKAERYVFEFKYVTKEENITLPSGMIIHLKNQGAYDEKRYGSWRDIEEIEKLRGNGFNGGYFLLMTNDKKLLEPTKSKNNDYEFDLSDGHKPIKSSPLFWTKPTSSMAKTHKAKIHISGKYDFKHISYPTLKQFEYLVVRID